MNTCDLNETLGRYHDGELSADARLCFEKHLAGCAECVTELEQLHTISRMLRGGALPRASAEFVGHLESLASNVEDVTVIRFVRRLTAAAAAVLLAATLHLSLHRPAAPATVADVKLAGDERMIIDPESAVNTALPDNAMTLADAQLDPLATDYSGGAPLSRVKLFIVLGFGIMFVAGLETGSHATLSSVRSDVNRLVAAVTGKTEPAPATQPAKAEPRHMLFGEIQLTASQDDQVHKIYRDAHARTDIINRQFRDLDHQRDEEIAIILDPQQRFEYEEIQHERDARVNALRAEIASAMEKAGTEVRSILTDDQQKKYDEVKKKFDDMRDRGHRGPGAPPWRGGPSRHPHAGSPDSAPSDLPDTAPAQ